jgi:hypothetical protein
MDSTTGAGVEDAGSLDWNSRIVIRCGWKRVLKARSQDCLRYSIDSELGELLFDQFYSPVFGAAFVGGVIGYRFGLA